MFNSKIKRLPALRSAVNYQQQLYQVQQSVQSKKSELETLIANARQTASHGELADLYQTSVMAYTASEFWANNVQMVPFDLLDKNGEPVPKESNLAISVWLRSPQFAQFMRRTELTMRFWGYSLGWKRRNIFDVTRRVDWVNPFNYRRESSWFGGLQYFSLTSGRGQKNEVGILYPSDAVYITGFSFDDEYDGVSSAEVAFLEASTEPELAMTRLVSFRNMAMPLLTVQPAVDQPGYEDDEAEGLKTSDNASFQDFFIRLFKGSRNVGKTLATAFRYEYQQLQPPYKDMVLNEQKKDIQESITQAFQLDAAFFTAGTANYAELEGKYKWWLKQQLRPRLIVYGDALTEQICDVELPGYTIAPDLTDVLREDEAAKIATVKEKQSALIITIGQAQEAMGQEIDETIADYYLIEGVPVPKAEVPNLWRTKFNTPAAPQLPAAPAVTEVTTDAEKALEPEVAPPATGKPLWIGLDLTNDPDLIALQQSLQSANPAIKWNTPEEFHTTLVYVPIASDEQVTTLQDLLTGFEFPALALNIGSINSFASPTGDYTIHFQIRSNTALYDLQRQLYDLCVEAGMAIPTYSRPMEYTPHITMGQAPEKLRQTFKSKIKVEPVGLCVDVDKAELIRIAPGEGYDPTPPDDDPTDKESLTVETGDAAKSAAPVYVPVEVFKEIEVAVRKAAKGQAFTPVHLTTHTAAYIKALKSVGMDDLMVIEGAKGHHVRVTAAKALSTTRSNFEKALVDLFQKDIKKPVFISRMDVLLERYCRQAMIDGFADGGIEDIDLDDPDDVSAAAALRWLEAHIDDQKQYVKGVADKLFSDESLSDEEIESNKPILWWNKSVVQAYNYGLVDASGNTLGEFKQVKSTIDTCVDCVNLRGQKRRMFDWNRYFEGDLPPSSKTFCQGFNCGDMLVPASGKVSAGKLPRLHGASKSAHHVHA